MNLKEPNNQDSSKSKDSNKSGIKMMMIACCAIAIAIIFFTGGSFLSWWLIRSNPQPSNPKPASQPNSLQKP